MRQSPAYSRPRRIRDAPAFAAPGYARPTADELRIERPLLDDLAPPAAVSRAISCADAQGVSLIDALIACADVDPEDVTARLARRLRVGFLGDLELPPDVLSTTAANAAVHSGIIRLTNGTLILGLRGKAVVHLARLLEAEPQTRERVLLASPQTFSMVALQLARHALTDEITRGPERVDTSFSARSPGIARATAVGVSLIVLGSILAAVYAPLAASLAFGALFMTLTVLRLLAARPDPEEPDPPRTPEHLLPVYTVLLPLFRERACVPDLVAALDRLDYPRAKLDIKLLIESDDRETADALAGHRLPNHFEVLTVPPGQPRTKPRALNAGLLAARGSLLTIFDAEDRPEPGQLRNAAAAFMRGGPRLACVQARLVIDNLRDGWLTRIFALEYAGLFDALLPALSRTGLMFPLGGTSNHFRTAVLDLIGGWDAWNVTEDADLGLRLARLGYRARVIASSTLEEAPNRTGSWLRQRTRWLKGYMLTWTVHMRQPGRLLRELGLVNFLAFHAFIGGVPLSAIILPVFLCCVGIDIAMGVWLSPNIRWYTAPAIIMHGFNLILGFGTAMALAAIGADRRGLTRLAGWIPTVPAYWLLSSVAAYRAIWQLMRSPYLWEKTEHGLAKTSASGADIKGGA